MPERALMTELHSYLELLLVIVICIFLYSVGLINFSEKGNIEVPVWSIGMIIII